MSETQEKTVLAVYQDGYLVDEFGEILEIETPRPEFTVDDESSAEWVLEKFADAEAKIIALNAKKESVMARLDASIREQVKRIEGLERRFGPSLIEYSRSVLPKNKKSARFTFGTVKFRDFGARVKINDKETALNWALSLPDDDPAKSAIKVEMSVQVSKLPADTMQKLEEGLLTPEKHGLILEPAREAVTIETITAEKKGRGDQENG